MSPVNEESVQDCNLERSISSLCLDNKDPITLPKAEGVASTYKPKFSCYNKLKAVIPNGEQTVAGLAGEIHSCKHEEKCKLIAELKAEKLRHEEGSDDYKRAKNKHTEAKCELPCVTPSGVFKRRANDQLIKHTGLAQLDIDGGDNPFHSVDQLKEIVTNDPHTHIAFLSPSRDGYKALVKFDVAEDGSDHGACYDSLINHYKRAYGLKIDKSCREVSRALYLSSDKDIFTRPLAKVKAFNGREAGPEVIEPKPLKQYQLSTRNNYSNSRTSDEEAEVCLSFLDPDMVYAEWRAVGAGCHAKGASFSVWDSWSQGGRKYEPAVCDDEWSRFKADGGINFGTVIEMATHANGGVDPLNSKRARTTSTAKDFTVIGEQETVRHPIPDVVSLGGLIVEHPNKPEPIIEGVLGVGDKMIVSAPSKAGKTWLMLGLAYAVQNGSSWMGHATSRSEVLFVNFELTPAWLAERGRLVFSKSEGHEHPDVLNLKNYSLEWDKLINHVRDHIKSSGKSYGFIILDPIYKMLEDADENSNGDIARLLNDLGMLCLELGAGSAFSHHHSKGNKANVDAMDRMAGAGVWARDPDAIIDLVNHEKDNCYVVETIPRNYIRPPKLVVQSDFPVFHVLEDEDPNKVRKAGGSRKKLTEGDVTAICDGTPAGITKPTLIKQTAKAHGVSEETARKMVKSLLDDGMIKLDGKLIKPLESTDECDLVPKSLSKGCNNELGISQ